MTERTTEDLQVLQSEMLATATDLGMEVPEDLTLEFSTPEVGKATCDSLDKLIKEFRSGVDSGEESTASETDPPKTKKQKKSSKKASKTKAPPEAPDGGGTTEENDEVTTTTAKKTTAKKATAKKTSTKQTPKKAAAPSKAKKAAAKSKDNARTPVARSKFKPTDKITAIVKDPPELKKDTKWAERLKKVYAAVGKTVEAFKGSTSDLTSAVKKGLIRVG